MHDRTLVLDASVVLKWVIPEQDSLRALALRKRQVLAPDLIAFECANALWKKVRRNEMSSEDARDAARLLQLANMELAPTMPLLEQALDIALALAHPAYDCAYLALAKREECKFITADARLLARVKASPEFRDRVFALQDVRLGDT